ncbi:MAG: GNAT family N-acetyltransferase [Alphaproteobacteria bacterium]|nr:GNAT family N-acetyltransferase [Alphaproteobacteria bacterium]
MLIRSGDFTDPAVVSLIEHYFRTARAATDNDESAHALDIDGLQAPDVRFWTAHRGTVLAGIGALKQIAPDHGEIKSMHTVATMRGTGVADTMLRHLLQAAADKGFRRVSLETGSMEFFAPARALYFKHGFVACGPFASYVEDPLSFYMTRGLSGG